ncbi:MAG: ATP-binding cassette domain-containing protein [Bacteroidales bacterium]|nr:ATP-binding cassette domain-containing protein [Bacteroidales bacterium]
MIESSHGIHIRNRDEIKHIIGVVPQDIALYPTLTARENLHFIGSMYGLQGKHLKERVSQCLAVFGLEKFASRLIGNYSGGMKRRINLIAGILHLTDHISFAFLPRTIGNVISSGSGRPEAKAVMVLANHDNAFHPRRLGCSHNLACIERGRIEYGRIGIAITPFLVFKRGRREMDDAVKFCFMPCQLPF